MLPSASYKPTPNLIPSPPKPYITGILRYSVKQIKFYPVWAYEKVVEVTSVRAVW